MIIDVIKFRDDFDNLKYKVVVKSTNKYLVEQISVKICEKLTCEVGEERKEPNFVKYFCVRKIVESEDEAKSIVNIVKLVEEELHKQYIDANAKIQDIYEELKTVKSFIKFYIQVLDNLDFEIEIKNLFNAYLLSEICKSLNIEMNEYSDSVKKVASSIEEVRDIINKVLQIEKRYIEDYNKDMLSKYMRAN